MGYVYDPKVVGLPMHQMSVNNKFESITRGYLLALAALKNFKEKDAIIEEVCEEALHWVDIAKDCGVSKEMAGRIITNMFLLL